MHRRFTVRELCVCALLGAMVHAAKFAMSFLPNIEPVTLLLAVYAVALGGRRAMAAAAVFVGLEGLLYGFGLWFWCYAYAWPLWVLAAWLLRRCESRLVWAAAAGAYGLCFGALFALPYLFLGGPAMALSYWVSGIPWDILHGTGNFVLFLCLMRPLMGAFRAMRQKIRL